MSDEPKLGFKLREGGRSLAEDVERAREAFAASHTAVLRDMRVSAPAFDVAAILRSLQPTADAYDALRLAVAEASKPARQMIEAWAAFAEQITREVETAAASLRAWFDSLDEDEREEIRRAIRDAPPEEVDVNANELGAM